MPGESFLAALDGFYQDRDRIRFVACRHEGGAAFMAEAQGRLTDRLGICFVTRGPGASNAAIGEHTAFQDSTPIGTPVGVLDAAGPAQLARYDHASAGVHVALHAATIDRFAGHPVGPHAAVGRPARGTAVERIARGEHAGAAAIDPDRTAIGAPVRVLDASAHGSTIVIAPAIAISPVSA